MFFIINLISFLFFFLFCICSLVPSFQSNKLLHNGRKYDSEDDDDDNNENDDNNRSLYQRKPINNNNNNNNNNDSLYSSKQLNHRRDSSSLSPSRSAAAAYHRKSSSSSSHLLNDSGEWDSDSSNIPVRSINSMMTVFMNCLINMKIVCNIYIYIYI